MSVSLQARFVAFALLTAGCLSKGQRDGEEGRMSSRLEATTSPTPQPDLAKDAGLDAPDELPIDPGLRPFEVLPLDPVATQRTAEERLRSLAVNSVGAAVARCVEQNSRYKNGSLEPEDIVTDFRLELVESISGNFSAIVTIPGGSVGPQSLSVVHTPTMDLNHTYLVIFGKLDDGSDSVRFAEKISGQEVQIGASTLSLTAVRAILLEEPKP
jgi:hypothetical protein